MIAIHQQKRQARRQIIQDLKGYYRNLPRQELEYIALRLAEIVAFKMTLAGLQGWPDRICKAMTEA